MMARVRTFGQRLAFGLGLVLAFTATMIVVSIVALGKSAATYDHAVRTELRGELETERLRGSAARLSASVRGFLLTAEPDFERRADRWEGDFRTSIEALRAILGNGDSRPLLEALTTKFDSFAAAARAIMVTRRASTDLQAISDRFEKEVMPLWDATDATFAMLHDALAASADAASADAEATADGAVTTIIVVGIASFVVALLVAVYLTRTLGRHVGGSVQHVRGAAAELQAAASQQASGAKEQATAMAEITTTISELLVTARQIASSAQRVSLIAGDTALGANQGEALVRSAQEAVGAVRRQIEALVQHTLDLGRRSQQIGGIIELINELADQTNILAINASIEAAGAGESGRRFGVVGEEIRRLADRVGGSTRDIRRLIDEIRGAVNTTVMATEAGSKAVDGAIHRFADLASVFGRISGGVATTSEAAKEIELSTQQQTSAVEQVNVGVSNVAQATREAEAAAGQTLQTAAQLATMSTELMRVVRAEAG